jgi:hypothetical protein
MRIKGLHKNIYKLMLWTNTLVSSLSTFYLEYAMKESHFEAWLMV